MESTEGLRQRVYREQQRFARLRLAATRLGAAQQERIWAIVGAHKAGLSIRQIARATRLSPSQDHHTLVYRLADTVGTRRRSRREFASGDGHRDGIREVCSAASASSACPSGR